MTHVAFVGWRGRGEGGWSLDEKDRVARGARERSGNWRRNGERRETRKPGRNNDFPRGETRNFLLRKGGSFSFSINCFVPKERGVYFILGEIWKLESISILISFDSFCEFLSRIDLEKLERYKFSVSKVEKFRKYPRISNSFYQFFKGSRVLCTKSKRIGGKFDQRSLNLTFLNEIFYSAYYIPR